jgi:hypothetical protein
MSGEPSYLELGVPDVMRHVRFGLRHMVDSGTREH